MTIMINNRTMGRNSLIIYSIILALLLTIPYSINRIAEEQDSLNEWGDKYGDLKEEDLTINQLRERDGIDIRLSFLVMLFVMGIVVPTVLWFAWKTW